MTLFKIYRKSVDHTLCYLLRLNVWEELLDTYFMVTLNEIKQRQKVPFVACPTVNQIIICNFYNNFL